jgi:4-hydroxy-2-oxoheptanedioate aldolase
VTAPEISLRQRLRSRAPLHGLILKLPCQSEIEMAAQAADFVVLDTEHGPGGDLALADHLRAADAAGLAALVRVPKLDPAAITAALDAGAAGIVVPHVADAEQAAAAVRAAHYPPDGERGWALSTRAARYGAVPADRHLLASAQVCVVAQLEDPDAVSQARQIAAVPGIDALFPGGADIAAAVGKHGQEHSSEVRALVVRVLDAARREHIGGVAVASDRSTAVAMTAAGATTVLAVGTSLTRAAFANAATWKAQNATAGRGELVMIAGMLSDARVWDGLRARLDHVWQPNTVRIDLDATVASMAESVLAQAPPTFVVVGHSLGGIVAQELLLAAPARVAGAVLIATSAREPSDTQRQAWEELAERTHQGDFGTVVTEQPDLLLGPSARNRPDLRATVTDMARNVGASGLLNQLAAQHQRTDLRNGLPRVRCPVVVLSGTDDTVCPSELQHEIVESIPSAEHVRLDGVGHMIPLEAPDAVCDSIHAVGRRLAQQDRT